MTMYTSSIPNLPGWQVKVRTQWFNGQHVASVTLPVQTGMVTLNESHKSEHKAVHMVLASLTALVARINSRPATH